MTTKYKRKHVPQVTSTVLFKFTEAEHKKINTPFRHSLDILKSGQGTQTDWFNTIFRIKCALLITEKEHERCTVDQLKHVYTICEQLEVRARVSQHKKWDVTPEEAEWLDAAFDAIEELQRSTNRKFYYDTCVKANYQLREQYVAGQHWKQHVKKPE